jgi:predicted ATPase/tetratricopeptide (TPR) repeat protein
METMEKRKIFISYCRKDEEWKKKILPHLGVLYHRYDIQIWHDRTIKTGDDWHERIGNAVHDALAAILLISADYLNSEYVRTQELPLLLKARSEEGLRIIPVVIGQCAWRSVGWLSKLQVCTYEDRPLSECNAKEIDTFFSQLAADLDSYLAERPATGTAAQSSVRTNLALPTTSFVGRREEIKALKELLAVESVRLVTLVGPPGIGKTRLSIQVGREMADQLPGGCWFANLIDAVTLTGIAHAITQAFGFSLASAQMTQQEAIVELLKPRGPLLLILDNFEQVVHLAGDTVGYWLTKLPDAKFLATSREILNLSGEHEYRLDSLSLPPIEAQDCDMQEVLECESVKLFVERAQQSRQDFLLSEENISAVASICRELQGIPLSIELAAARIRIYSPAQMAQNLGEKFSFGEKFSLLRAIRRDQHDRQWTLFGSIDWSYQLLKPWEQHAFLQICIFRGDFFLDAAESVIDLSTYGDAPAVSEVVQSLCEKSLLNAHEMRYGVRFDMLVAIQEFGQAVWMKVAGPADQEALARRWAGFYIPYAQYWNERVHSTTGSRALDLLSLELENIFGIQDWFLNHGIAEIAADAILAFAETMAVRGPAHLRVPRLEKSLAKLDERHPELRLRLMTVLSAAHWSLGQWNEAMELANQAVALLPGLDPSAHAAAALRQQGRIRTDRGYLHRALSSLGGAREIYERLGNQSGISIIDGDMAGVFDRLGDLRKALSLLIEAEEMALGAGDEAQRALVLNRRGLALWHHGEAEAALVCFEEAERINVGLGAIGWIGGHRTNQGLVLTDLDEFERAFERFENAEKLHHESGNQAWAAVNYGGWGRAFVMRGRPGDLERGLELILKAEGLSRRVYYPENISFHVGDRGRVLFLLGRNAEARKAVREAVALERTIGASRDLRHFGNLVTLALIEEALSHEEGCREASLKAMSLKEKLALDKTHRIRRVREDVERLEGLEVHFAAGGGFERRISSLLEMAGSTPLTDADTRQISEAMTRALDEPSYDYPWQGFEENLRGLGQTKIKLFGYGSLVNRHSASRTLLGAVDRVIPVMAFGVLRLFNFEMPDAVKVRYLAPENPLERGLLNAQVTGFMSDVANGVLIEVGLDEIESLRSREVGYDLRMVACIEWDEKVGRNPTLAYILSCPDRLWKGKLLTNSELHPHRDYLEQCCEGAGAISGAFLQFWLNTTFLADGETCVRTDTT